ncbi:MAG: hypothetical protein HYU51_12910 [Candidatus Rokubacteria bacterium]|nr:hypothetical protein [Candidatus Rokubacteria bacterium]
MGDDSLQGWAPEPRDADELAHVVDMAFDYRGDVTIVLRDGTERVGYLFNRSRERGQAQLLEPAAAGPVTVRYADIRTIRFTGKDPASGKSYAAWLERKKADKAQTER